MRASPRAWRGSRSLPKRKEIVPISASPKWALCPKEAELQLQAGLHGWLQTTSFWMLPLWMDIGLYLRGESVVPLCKLQPQLGAWHPGPAVTPCPSGDGGGWLIYGREEPGVSPSGAGGELPWRWANKAPAAAGSDAAPVAESGRVGRRGSCHVGMERDKVTPGERDKSLVCEAVELSLSALRVEGNGGKEPSCPSSLGSRTSSRCSLAVSDQQLPGKGRESLFWPALCRLAAFPGSRRGL